MALKIEGYLETKGKYFVVGRKIYIGVDVHKDSSHVTVMTWRLSPDILRCHGVEAAKKTVF